ncbi:hypothetical protein AcW1_005414 [Taiwanofungus camphoratus]|nr:hypothetical protein AcV7_009274 [Antrodia cinnamomea]KAI0956829.1 hypothetical protein AcW1_005414 [Antrodia cinnamomea]
MILEALARLHSRNARARTGSSGTEADGEMDGTEGESQDLSTLSAAPSSATRRSARSTTTSASSVLHSPPSVSSLSSARGSNISRRMSNNLFGSGKFRDQAYLRSANQTRRTGSSRSAFSVTHSESTMSMNTIASSRAGQNTSMYSDSLRPSTPDGSTYTPSGSVPSSPNNDKTFEKESPRRSSMESRIDQTVETKGFGSRLSKALSPEGLRRASLALDEVIRELEEEGDDEIVMERSPIPHVSSSTVAANPERNSPMSSVSDHDAGTALSSDDQVVPEEAQRSSPYPRSRTTSPTPRLPGYIPGMPRPMTPRDPTGDSDDQTPSTTPRATSPRLPGVNSPPSPMVPQGLTSTLYRSSSNASTSRQSPHPTSSPIVASTPPLFFNRSTNGRFTPEDRQRNGNSSSTAESFDSPVIGRRRPTSPLSGPAYQPLTSVSSRPGTPSNVTWNMTSSPSSSKNLGGNGSMSGHSRNGSTASVTDASAEILERSKSTSRSLRSPALPDSPWVDGGNSSLTLQSEYRPPSAMSGMELGSPVQILNRALRSPTPPHSSQKSPTSPIFPDHASSFAVNGESSTQSRHSSKQIHHSSFSLGSAHALLLSPIANSSRSSMESVGSSYHSWDEDHKKDRLFGLFSNLDPQHTDWHDVSGLDKSSSSTPGTSPYESLEIEDAVRRQTGLTKGDFVAIQDKLVNAALTKAVTPDGRNRASSLRRRRPSTSQSNYSYNGMDNRVTSPTPQPQSPTITVPSRNVDHIAKIPADPPLSSPNRRHRALADALFGVEGKARPTSPVESPVVAGNAGPDAQVQSLNMLRSEIIPSQPAQPSKQDSSLRDMVSPTSPRFDASSSRSPHADAALLAIEVRQRAEAATAALRKSPSIPKIGEVLGTLSRKRINPNQISSPKLVSASTSVDTIPLPSPSVTSGHPGTTPSKLSSRFRKLRGTLRSKPPVHTGDEITPYPLDLRSPRSAPDPSFSASNVVLRPEPVISSTNDVSLFGVPAAPVSSPPASATPGLKGFMARFRKQRGTEVYSSPQRQRPSPPSAASLSPSSFMSSSHERSGGPSSHSAPATKVEFRSESSLHTRAPPAQSSTSRLSPEIVQQLPTISTPSQNITDEAALKQLFDAASNLGLDQAALNDLIARSPSTSSRSTAWTKLTRITSVTDSRKSQLTSAGASDTPDDPRSNTIYEGRPSMDRISPRPSTEIRQAPVRKPVETSLGLRQEQRMDNAVNSIVRRTIIFPSDARTSTVDLNHLIRKQSASKRRRSASAASVHSTRSIHERVPTPPPHKSIGGRRFSADGSPPIPQLPHSFPSQHDNLTLPAQMEKSSSTYDSLYEMYAGDSRIPNAAHAEAQGSNSSQHIQTDTIPESGPALEVIEMANGETIWSIVNGLRDDDGESFYGDRTSFVSEYSTKESNSDGLKLFFKGHERKSSKGSTTSFSLRKRQQHSKGTNRPETKARDIFLTVDIYSLFL